jgi:hypothetical protein
MNRSIAASLVKKAILDLESYLKENKVLPEGMNQAQMEECRRHLDIMLQQIESGNLPPQEDRESGMGHMIADSWPASRLGEALSQAEQAYRRLP